MIYKLVLVFAMFLSIMGCTRDDIDRKTFSYQIQGINAYRGQDVSDLFDANGAPNAIKRLDDNRIMWVYYTNYRPVGGGELISYDNPPQSKIATACMVRVILEDNIVQQIFTNCS
ncbi:MAG: hypothetical protein E7005_04520 [Alphaproteobacteria bacterium]|nr:hypothetical protein [Alphaproteobacteria bacterium]